MTAEDTFNRISEGLKSSNLGVTYEAPKNGGRIRKDGQRVAWQTTRAISVETESSSPPKYRTDLPFWCHDITPHEVRIPFDKDEITTHPSGAIGSAAVEVLVPPEQYDDYIKSYSIVLGAEPQNRASATSTVDGVDFLVGSPVNVGVQRPRVWVHTPGTEVDERWLREHGAGIRSFTVAVKERDGHGSVPLGSDGTASTIHLEW